MSDYKWTMWQFENVYHDTHLGYEGHFVRPHTSADVHRKIDQINTTNLDGSERILAKHNEALERAANVCITDSFFVNEDTDSPSRRPKSRATDFRKIEGDEFTPVVKAIMLTCAADAKKEKRTPSMPETETDDVEREMKLLMKKRVDVHHQDRGKKFLRVYDRSHKIDTKTLLHRHFTSRPQSAAPSRRFSPSAPSAPNTPRRSRPHVPRGRHIKRQSTDTDSDSEESITNKVDEFMHAVEQKQQQKAMTLLKDKFKTRRRKALLGPSAATAEDNNDIILGKENNIYKKIDISPRPAPAPAEAPRSQDKGFSAATMFIQRVLTNRTNNTPTTSAVTASMDSVQQTRSSPITTVESVGNPVTKLSPSTVPPDTVIPPTNVTTHHLLPPHSESELESTVQDSAPTEESVAVESPAEWLAKRMEQVKAGMAEAAADNTLDDLMNIRILSVEISLLFKGFQILDERSDGFLSYSDLRQYCTKYHVNLTKSVIENIMWLMDDSRRGYITFEEIKNFFLQFRSEFHESGLEFSAAKSPAVDMSEDMQSSMNDSNIHAHPLLLFRMLFFASMQDGEGCVHLLSAYQMLVQLFGANAEREFNCVFLKSFHNITDSDRISVRDYVSHVIEHQNFNARLKAKRSKLLGQRLPFRRSNKMMRKVVVNERRKALVPYTSFSSET